MRRVATIGLALALVLGLLGLHSSVARADVCIGPDGAPYVCGGGSTGGPPPNLSPADLLNPFQLTEAYAATSPLSVTGIYSATSAQIASLQNLETQAVSNTLADHGLVAGDAAAAQTWGRADAQGELFGLLVQAIQTQAVSRTADQQNAVNWLEAAVQRENTLADRDAGLEYVKWAALSQTQYQTLLSQNADYNTLDTFFKPTGAPYNYNSNPSTATEGYCVYVPPAPYQSEYTGNIYTPLSSSTAPQTCFNNGGISCTISCLPDSPTYDQFVKYGGADAQYQLINTTDYAQTSHNIALGLTLGTTAASVAAAAGVGAFALTGALAGTAFQTAIFPSAGVAFYTSVAAAGGNAAAAAAANAEAAAAAAANAGSVGAAGVGAIAGAVLLFVVGTTVEVINLVNATQLPDKIATLVTGAPGMTYDLNAMLGSSDGAGELYSLFVGATLPSPTYDTCDNSIIVSGLGETPTQCLNPAAIPDASQNDPEFKVQENGGPATYASSITWYDQTSQSTTTARLHETWFIDQVSDVTGTVGLVQSLRIRYTDWHATDQTAWLLNVPNVGYRFMAVTPQSGGTPLNPSTCLADATCAYTDTIQYVDGSGNQFAAQVIPAALPKVTANVAAAAGLTEGYPVIFSAQGSSPIGAALSYQWQFEDKAGLGTLTCDLQGNCTPAINYTAPIAGANVSHVFPTSGTFHVQLTATDSAGKQAVNTFTLNIADVPPQLSIYPPGVPSPYTICVPSPCHLNVFAVAVGSPTILGADVIHAGSEDNETIDINWGDGSPDDVCTHASQGLIGNYCPSNISLGSDATGTDGLLHLPFFGAHTYAGAGTYTVTITDTDQSGATTTATTHESALIPTQTTLSSGPNPAVYGQSVTFTATVSPAPGGGTVAFQDNGTPIGGCGAQSLASGTATCTTAALGTGPHTLTAVYTGDPTHFGSTSSPVSQTVNKASTGTTLSPSVNPTVYGQSVTLTATIAVNGPGAGNPSGTVEFKDGAGDIGSCAAQPVNTSTETATCTTSALMVATHSITATYSGDTNFNGSTSPALTQTVHKAAVTATLGTSLSPATSGQTVTFTAMVAAAAPGAGTPTGAVTFKDGATMLGTGGLSTSGGATTATLSTSGLSVGAHTIMATSGGDGNFLASAGVTLTQYVNTNLSGYPKLSSGAYNLSNANLSGGYFVGASLAGASLSGSNLTNAVFIGANLTGANLSNSNFMGSANFTNATLQNANLSNSNLKGANFAGTNLTGATFSRSNLTGATGLKTATLTSVVWYKTACPDGTNSSNDGGTCIGHL